MQLCVFGATGRTGRALVAVALEHGVAVRAFARVRTAASLPALRGLEVVRGEPTSVADLVAAVRGCDAVCVVFGPRSSAPEPFCAPFTRAILGAMREAGVRRLVCVTGAMIGEVHANVGRSLRAMAALARRFQPEVMTDRAQQEAMLTESDLDWTLVKPPRLTDAPRTGTVHADPTLPIGLFSSIGRADLAAFVFRAATHDRFVRQRVYVRG
jgi:putative NADH-flavin reductase